LPAHAVLPAPTQPGFPVPHSSGARTAIQLDSGGEGAELTDAADPLPAAVARCLPNDYTRCTACGGGRQLWIGRKGPFIKCGSAPCGQSTPVGRDIVATALRLLDLRCDVCHGPITFTQGRNSSGIACSRHPDCSYAVPWKIFRHQLRPGRT